MKDGLVLSDWMCGGGGSTEGIWRFFEAAGIPIKRFVAVNCDPKAIEVHSWNHPQVVHYCRNVSHVDLAEAFPDGYCDFAWGSPTCTQHSRARGGKAINDQLRTGPWQLFTISTEIHVKRWAVENVPELVDWAPLNSQGRPIKSRRGEIFRAWIAAWESIGYKVEWRISDATWWGAPTSRSRFLALLTKQGKIYWAIPTHDEMGATTDLFTGPKKPLEGVGKYLDLSLPSQGITSRKVPLAPTTLERGWEGQLRLWPASAVRVYAPDVRDACYDGLSYCNAKILETNNLLARKPKRSSSSKQIRERKTRMTKRLERLTARIDRYQKLLSRVLTFLEQPVSTTGGGMAQPFLITLRGTSLEHVRASAQSLDEPAKGVSSQGSHLAIATPAVEPIVGGNRMNNVARGGDEPAGGVTTATGGGLFAVIPYVQAVLLGQHGGGIARGENDPASTITSDGAASLFFPALAPLVIGTNHGGRFEEGNRPGPSVTTKNGLGVAEPYIVPASSSAAAAALHKPMGTQTTSQRGTQLVQPALLDAGLKFTAFGREFVDALAQLPESVKERLLIGEDGTLHEARLHFRMLSPHGELSPIMGFPRTYRWPRSPVKTTQLIGNAVHPLWAEAHVEAFLGPVYAPEYLERKYGSPEVAA